MRLDWGLAFLSVQQALISAYEKNRPLTPAMRGKHSLKWTYELKCLGSEMGRLFNKYQADKTPQSWNSADRLSRDIERR